MKKDKKKARKTIGAARAAVKRATQKLDDRLATLERAADGLETAAVERFQAEAIADLRDDQLLCDLADLQAAFTSKPPGALPVELEPFRLLPEAVLSWIQKRFGLTPHLEAGRLLQMPSEKLAGFTVDGDPGDPPAGLLVRVRVLAPGWMRGKDVVIPPRVEIVQ